MIRLNPFPPVVIVFLLFLSGCLENVNELNQKIIADEKRIDSIEKEIGSLSNRVTELEYKYVYLDPSVKGFERIDTSNGFFLISLIDVKPYLDGYKLILDIGNPTLADYKGFTLNVRWGRKIKDFKNSEEWSKSLQRKEVSFTKNLNPASWTKVELILSPATPEQLGYIQLSMETPTIGLFKSRR